MISWVSLLKLVKARYNWLKTANFCLNSASSRLKLANSHLALATSRLKLANTPVLVSTTCLYVSEDYKGSAEITIQTVFGAFLAFSKRKQGRESEGSFFCR